MGVGIGFDRLIVFRLRAFYFADSASVATYYGGVNRSMVDPVASHKSADTASGSHPSDDVAAPASPTIDLTLRGR